MSIIKITPDLIELVSLKTHPKVKFVSSSIGVVNTEVTSSSGIVSHSGTLGEVSLLPRTNRVIKSTRQFDITSALFNEDQLELAINLKNAVTLTEAGETDIQSYMGHATPWPHSSTEGSIDGAPASEAYDQGYMRAVNQAKKSSKQLKTFQISRFRPSFLFEDEGFTNHELLTASLPAKTKGVKSHIENVLLKKYKSHYTNPNYSYTNYHSLNFFTSSHTNTLHGHSVVSSSVLIYPCMTSSNRTDQGPHLTGTTRFTGRYCPEGAFTFDFYINPRYSNDGPVGQGAGDSNNSFNAGTIFHMSSTFAVSLISGSSVDEFGKCDGYRLLLQLSHSAGYPPSRFTITASSNNPVYNGNLARYKDRDFRYAFLSPDNSLQRNKWHHVAIRWGTKNINDGTGSFFIDGNEVSRFCIPETSIAQTVFTLTDDHAEDNRVNSYLRAAGKIDADSNQPISDPDALFIGNFYEGKNTTGSNATSINRFFNWKAQNLEGFSQGQNSGQQKGLHIEDGDPKSYAFNHPLNAEVHDLKIYASYRTSDQILTSSRHGPENSDDLLFYLPPFFVKEGFDRRFFGTAVQTIKKHQVAHDQANDSFFDTYLSRPFNAGLSMTVDSTLINLENFCRDLVQGVYPRLLFLTASAISDVEMQTQYDNKEKPWRFPNGSVSAPQRRVSDLLFSTASLAKRCLTILPCDNGKFLPNYSLILSGANDSKPTSGSEMSLFVDDYGHSDISSISLKNLFTQTPTAMTLIPDGGSSVDTIVDTLNYYTGTGVSGLYDSWRGSSSGFGDGDMSDENTGPLASPDRPNGAICFESTSSIPRFMVYQATQDSSSNEVVIFNIPNLFYGNRISPGTFKLSDKNLSGSRGKVSMTLKDDGFGTLYRADSITENAKFNCVGNIFYEEGLVLIKSPHLVHFGKREFEMEFKGDQNIHVMSVNVPCEPGLVNSSSNPAFKSLSASFDANDYNNEFVYITSVYLHDDNFNVIMKANLAQPVVKRESDEFLFRIKMDF